MKTVLAALCTVILWPWLANATPQIAVRSADNCGTCHVDPIDWENPALDQRKCSLNCATCHVVPTGSGMRNESGLYYGQVTLPTWLKRTVPPVEYRRPAIDAPTTQPDAAGSQPDAAGSQPVAAGSQPDAAGSQPDAAGSQPDAAGSQPSSTSEVTLTAVVPEPGTAGRYGGIEPFPFFQVGADVRLMAYVPNSPTDEAAVFPMETDLQLALRPYNPRALNQGRLTLYASPAALGARKPEGLDPEDRFFIREYFAMYHDLPYQLYARVGRFLPAFGWKLDDHTAFIRQEQLLLGAPFDHERGVTGVELGVNPNYFFAHLSAFNASDDWKRPVDADAGWGAALHTGWRDLPWHIAGSLMVGGSERLAQQMVGVNWALNLAPLGWFPLSYLGEYDLNRTTALGGEPRTGLAAFHELNYLLYDGVNLKTRYEWQDGDIDAAYDSRHRAVLGFEWHAVRHLEIIAQYRHNWAYAEERWSAESDDMFLQLHGWY